MSVTKLVTADDLLAMGSDAMVELIEGELVDVSPSEHYSSELSLNLVLILGEFVRTHRLGRISGENGGFLLSRDPDTVVAPDIGFVRLEKAPQRLPRGQFVPFAPDLAVEIMSKSNTYPEMDRKARLYLDAGTSLVWVVEPEQESVIVYRSGEGPITLRGDDLITGEDLLPGFSLSVSELFRDPLTESQT